ncbi:hypothetical protein PL11201_620090 [Planktothrix sp. PCC 11201]|nr:hypothetical protein PL11201_620090 [Planktothrix sp. PCC 11201]
MDLILPINGKIKSHNNPRRTRRRERGRVYRYLGWVHLNLGEPAPTKIRPNYQARLLYINFNRKKDP